MGILNKKSQVADSMLTNVSVSSISLSCQGFLVIKTTMYCVSIQGVYSLSEMQAVM